MSLGQFRASAAARSMSPGSTTAGTTGGRTLTGTFRTGEDRLRSTNAVTVLDVPEPHDARFSASIISERLTP